MLEKNKSLYLKYVLPYIYQYKRISITQEEYNKIEQLAIRIVTEKQKEEHHKYDNQKEIKRFITGFMGELAVEKLFHIPIINWTTGESKKYNYPDILHYKIGIKTVEVNKLPIIFKRNDYAQIICIYHPDINKVDICGLATKEILNKYQNEDYILSPKLKKRGVKTAFYGFAHLIPIDEILFSNYKVKERIKEYDH